MLRSIFALLRYLDGVSNRILGHSLCTGVFLKPVLFRRSNSAALHEFERLSPMHRFRNVRWGTSDTKVSTTDCSANLPGELQICAQVIDSFDAAQGNSISVRG
jgi:hypothetical protein